MRWSNVIVEVEIIVPTPDDVEATKEDAEKALKVLPIWHHVSSIRVIHSTIE